MVGGPRPALPYACGENPHYRHRFGDTPHEHRAERLEPDIGPRAYDVRGCLRAQHLARSRKIDDPGGEIDVAPDDVVAASPRGPPVDANAHPERNVFDTARAGFDFVGRVFVVGPLVDAVELTLEAQARVDRFVRIVEPEQQSVAELLHDPCRRGKCRPDHALLSFEERERDIVAVMIGECREADDVGEDDGAVLAHRSLETRIAPLTVATAISQSSPGARSQRTRPLTERSRVVGRVSAGTRISTLPETVWTDTRSPPDEPSSTLPLTVLTSAPLTRSSNTTPDTAATVARSAEAMCTDELFVMTRHSPEHVPMSIFPDFVRASMRAASRTLILPLVVATRTAPSGPERSTAPDIVPTVMSVPGEHRTSISFAEGARRTWMLPSSWRSLVPPTIDGSVSVCASVASTRMSPLRVVMCTGAGSDIATSLRGPVDTGIDERV